MDDITRIVVDAMGGDNAPTCNIQGAVDSVNIHKDVHIILVGKEDIIKEGFIEEYYKQDLLFNGRLLDYRN